MIHTERETGNRLTSFPTKDYVYPNVPETLETLLSQGHRLVIWTNEFPENVGTSRLGFLRRALPPNEKKRLSLVTATASEDKLTALPYLFREAQNYHSSSIVIIDNTKEKLEKTGQIIKESDIQKDIKMQLLWVTDTLPFQTISPCSFTPEIDLVSIPSLNDITSLEHSRNTLFLIDFNDTIIDTKKWEADFNLQNRIRDYQ